MKRQLKAMLYFFGADLRHSFLIFWSILIAITIISIIGALVLTNFENGKVFLTISMPVYVYAAILGFITVKESLPFVIKMGGTRKNFFIAIGILFLGLSLLIGLIQNILHSLINILLNIFEINNFNLLHVAAIMQQQDSLLYRFSIDICLSFFFLSTFFFLGLIFYKYGILGGFSSMGIVLLTLIFASANVELLRQIINILSDPALYYFTILLGAGVVFYGLSWLLLRKISTISYKV